MQSVAGFLSRWSPSLANKALSAGLEVYDAGDHARAFTEFRVLASQGNASAQAMLGRMYHNGEGVAVNLDEAARWIRSAAEEGVPDAQFNLGVMYEGGKGVSQNLSEALRWYRLAAQRGSADAQINLSSCFHNGLGVKQDELLAAWWVSLAAEQGDIDAQLNFATRYMNGIGVTKDAFEAFFWFDLAAKAGNTNAIRYKATVTQELTPVQVEDAQRVSQDCSWKPKSAEDSALQIFKGAAGQTIDVLKQTLGEEGFGELRTTTRKTPSVGEVILAETHGIRQVTMAKSIKNVLAGLERKLDFNLSAVDDTADKEHIPDLSAMVVLGFIRRIDDIADVGTFLGDCAADLTYNLLEYHLSLIGLLDKRIESDSLEILLKRFSLRQALRSPGLIRYSGLHNVVLPLLPW
jgi:TPR repeat protein